MAQRDPRERRPSRRGRSTLYNHQVGGFDQVDSYYPSHDGQDEQPGGQLYGVGAQWPSVVLPYYEPMVQVEPSHQHGSGNYPQNTWVFPTQMVLDHAANTAEVEHLVFPNLGEHPLPVQYNTVMPVQDESWLDPILREPTRYNEPVQGMYPAVKPYEVPAEISPHRVAMPIRSFIGDSSSAPTQYPSPIGTTNQRILSPLSDSQHQRRPLRPITPSPASLPAPLAAPQTVVASDIEAYTMASMASMNPQPPQQYDSDLIVPEELPTDTVGQDDSPYTIVNHTRVIGHETFDSVVLNLEDDIIFRGPDLVLA